MTANQSVLAGLLMVVVGVAGSAGAVVLTGDVEADFVGPTVFVLADVVNDDVGIPGLLPPATSGWDLADARFAYSAGTDRLYVGVNSKGVIGDVDGDGDPSGSPSTLGDLGGVDLPNLSGTETVSVFIDLNRDGTLDIVAGVSEQTSAFSVATVLDSFNPAFSSPFDGSYGTELPGLIGAVVRPSNTPGATDFEFVIENFSAASAVFDDTDVLTFDVRVFAGSESDDGIGEDVISDFSLLSTVTLVPEPGSLAVLALGGLVLLRRR